MLKLSSDELIQVKGGVTCVELAISLSASGGLTGQIQDTNLLESLKNNNSNFGAYRNEIKDLSRGCDLPESFVMTGSVPPSSQ